MPQPGPCSCPYVDALYIVVLCMSRNGGASQSTWCGRQHRSKCPHRSSVMWRVRSIRPAGAAVAIGLSQFIASLLFGIAATDAKTLVAVVAGVTAVGALACAMPARRASRLDPLFLI